MIQYLNERILHEESRIVIVKKKKLNIKLKRFTVNRKKKLTNLTN